MIFRWLCYILLLNILFFYYTDGLKFENNILGVCLPFYKLLMTMGTCRKMVIYNEENAWGKVRLNRVMDIYYKSSDPEYLVSKVEIRLVINNTDCSVFSTKGVGRIDFSATMFVPVRVSVIFYRLTVFTCSNPLKKSEPKSDESTEIETLDQLVRSKTGKFYFPFYMRPDSPPHHMIMADEVEDEDDSY